MTEILISLQEAIKVIEAVPEGNWKASKYVKELKKLNPVVQQEIILCRECKHWRQQTNYQGALMSFGFCESDKMWESLYGDTTEIAHIDTDDDFFCKYAERKDDV